MDSVKDFTKKGWHPKGKEGGQESWRGDFKGIGQVAGWVGHGKGSGSAAASSHTATPISNLKDPNSFGPPPKTVAYHGIPATSSSPLHSENDPPGSLAQSAAQAIQDEKTSKPAPPPVPFRVDTTGLSTANLPKPPVRHPETPIELKQSPQQSPKTPPPKLPPRLPPRALGLAQNPHTNTLGGSKNQPSQQGYINQGALDRLGSAGISVPGLGIGENSRPSSTSAESLATTDGAGPTNKPNISSIQSRFSKLSTASATSPTTAPSEGTSFADKQAAFRTASQFRNDPSSVGLADAKKAAVVGNVFRARHGDQVASGLKTGKAMNEKYGVAGKLSSFSSGLPERGATDGSSITPPATAYQATTSSPTLPSSPGKKPPPPLPPKKVNLSQGGDAVAGPPPVPLATKPKK